MITFLSGGTGTPKLLRGMQNVLPPGDIAVVVNTAEDIWISGNHISPDIDTVMYLFAGILNTGTWWGIKNDTFTTHDEAVRLGLSEFIAIGDRDRAVHMARGELLRKGMRLTDATTLLCERFGVRQTVLPMTDTGVTTQVMTERGLIHFQEYWIRERGSISIRKVVRTSDTPPVATEESLAAVRSSDAVVIGPSNPITSIGPILACDGMKQALEEKFVVAVSPFIGNAPVSGPAGALMEAAGYEPSAAGTLACYDGIPDIFVQDIRDNIAVSGSVRFDTLMTDEKKSLSLARDILSLICNR